MRVTPLPRHPGATEFCLWGVEYSSLHRRTSGLQDISVGQTLLKPEISKMTPSWYNNASYIIKTLEWTKAFKNGVLCLEALAKVVLFFGTCRSFKCSATLPLMKHLKQNLIRWFLTRADFVPQGTWPCLEMFLGVRAREGAIGCFPPPVLTP